MASLHAGSVFRLLFAFAALVGSSISSSAAASDSALTDTVVVRPFARAFTQPVPHDRDAADTPDIWVHPTSPERSLVIGSDKRGGLMVYDMDGNQRQIASDGSRPNDVNVLYGFLLRGKRVDIVVAGCRSLHAMGVKVWVIDPVADTLADATAGGIIPVFAGTVPYGTCVYRSPRDGRCYFFVTNKQGQVEQYRLRDAGDGTITGIRVRGFSVETTAEGCVADNETGNYFLSEERVGIWRFGAEPDAGSHGTLIARVGEHGLEQDVEGLTIYYAAGGAGYLIASSQGNSTFKVYERQGDNRFILTIDPEAGAIGDVHHTDGIAVTNRPTSTAFPKGVFAAQDGHNEGLNQNFKLYGWEDIAGSRLRVDTGWSPRLPDVPPALAAKLAGAGSAPRTALADAGSALDAGGMRTADNEPLVSTEVARAEPPGSVWVGVGLEREKAIRWTESEVPFAVDVSARRWLELIVEPVVYSRMQASHEHSASGPGDLEITAVVKPGLEIPGRLTPAVATEVKIPTARGTPLGSGKADYTVDLVLGRRVAALDTHLNLGYTVIGQPSGVRTRNVYSYSFAAEREFSRFALLAEVYGHTRATASVHDPETTGGANPGLPDLAGEELIATLGAKCRVGERTVLSLGISYDNDHLYHVRPGLSVRLR